MKLPRERAKVVADAAKMREEMAAHKPPSGPLDVKLGPGGLVDLEFAVHVLQLTVGHGLDPSLELAVRHLADADLIPANIVEAQRLLTQMLVVNRLVAPRTATPNDENQLLVARLCGSENWPELLGRHAEARQSIGELWQQVKDSK